MRFPSPLRGWRSSFHIHFGGLISLTCLVFAGIWLLAPPRASAQQSGLSAPMNLAQMVDEAENVVLGRVVSVKAEKHPDFQNLDTVVVTLDILDPLKGTPGKQYTFRLFVFDVRDRDSNLGYRVGEELVLLLRQPSQYKLTSPVGLEQGRFHVERDAQGNRLLRNGNDNAALFADVEKGRPNLKAHLTATVQQLVAQHQSGPISYDAFKSFVQGALAARQAAQ